MKYAILLLLVLFTMLGCGSPITRTIEMPGAGHVVMAEVLKNRAVALVDKDPALGTVDAFCSGVWVSPTEILTAEHCVRGVDYTNYVVNSDVFSSDDPTLPRLNIPVRFAIVVRRDADHDLALLGAYKNTPLHDVAPVFPGEVAQGQLVQTMGQPIGLWFSYSSGEIAALRVMPSASPVHFEMLMIQATAPISPGNSGGGLFDQNGMVVGITHAAFQGDGAENLNIFVHTKYIRKFLAQRGS